MILLALLKHRDTDRKTPFSKKGKAALPIHTKLPEKEVQPSHRSITLKWRQHNMQIINKPDDKELQYLQWK